MDMEELGFNFTQTDYCVLFNNTENPVCWYVKHDPRFYLKMVSMISIIFIGLIGNFLLAYTILMSKRLRSKSINIFIVNLSLSNFLNLFLAAPSVLVDSLTEFFVLKEIGCKGNRVVQTVFFLVPMLTLLVISVDRYLAIKYPFRDLKYNNRAVIICVIIWCIGIGVSLPQYRTKVFQSYQFKDFILDVCLEKWDTAFDTDTTPWRWRHERIYKYENSLVNVSNPMILIPGSVSLPLSS